MKPSIANQEILLFTGTSFSKKELCEKTGTSERMIGYPQVSQLEKACWAGLLEATLPELKHGFPATDRMFIWNVLCSRHFVLVSQGTRPVPVNTATSVDPHLFLLSFHQN